MLLMKLPQTLGSDMRIICVVERSLWPSSICTTRKSDHDLISEWQKRDATHAVTAFAVDTRQHGIMFNAVPEGLSRICCARWLGNNTSIDTPFSSPDAHVPDRFPASKPPLHLTAQALFVAFTNDPHYALTQADILIVSPTSSETRSPVAYNTSTWLYRVAPVADQLMVPVINVNLRFA